MLFQRLITLEDSYMWQRLKIVIGNGSIEL